MARKLFIKQLVGCLMLAMLAGLSHAIPHLEFVPEDNNPNTTADDQLKAVNIRFPDDAPVLFGYVDPPFGNIVPEPTVVGIPPIEDYQVLGAMARARETWEKAKYSDFRFDRPFFPASFYPLHPNNNFGFGATRVMLDGFNIIAFGTDEIFADDAVAAETLITYFYRDFDPTSFPGGIFEANTLDFQSLSYISQVGLTEEEVPDYDNDGYLDIFMFKTSEWKAGEVIDCDIAFNPDAIDFLRAWPEDRSDILSSEEPRVNGSLDLQAIMTTMLGRPIGLDNSDIRDSVMFPFIEPEGTLFPTNPYRKRQLSFDDQMTVGLIHGQNFKSNLASISGNILEGQFISAAVAGDPDAIITFTDPEEATLDQAVIGVPVYLMVQPEVLQRSKILSGGMPELIVPSAIHPDNVEVLPVLPTPYQGFFRKVALVMSGQDLRIPAAAGDDTLLFPLPEFADDAGEQPGAGGLDDDLFEVENLGQFNSSYFFAGIPAVDDFGTTITYAVYIEEAAEIDLPTPVQNFFVSLETYPSEFYGGNGGQISIGNGTAPQTNSTQDQEFENAYLTVEVSQEGQFAASINDGPTLLSGFRSGPRSFFQVDSPSGRFSNRLTNIGGVANSRFIDDFNETANAKWLRANDFSVDSRWQITPRGGISGIPAGVIVSHVLTNVASTTRTFSFRQVLDTNLFGKENPVYVVNSFDFVGLNAAAAASVGVPATTLLRGSTLTGDQIPAELIYQSSVSRPAFRGFITLEDGSITKPSRVTIGTLGELDKNLGYNGGASLRGLNASLLDSGVALHWDNIVIPPNGSVPFRFIVGFLPPGGLLDTWLPLGDGDIAAAAETLQTNPAVDDPFQIEPIRLNPGENLDGIDIVTNTAEGGDGEDQQFIPIGGPGTPAFFTLEANAFPQTDFITAGGALGDIDNDGDLDLITAGYGGGEDPVSSRLNRIYINRQRTNPDGTISYFFEDSTFGDDGFANSADDRWLGPSGQPNATTVVSTDVILADFDGDGDLDVFIINQNAPNRMYMNLGNPAMGDYTNIGRFQDISEQVLPGLLNLGWEATGTIEAGYRAVAGDIDNDGDVDLIISQLIPFGDSLSGLYPPSEAWIDIDPEDTNGDGRINAAADQFTFSLVWAERVLINQINTPNYSPYTRGFYFRDETLGADDRGGTLTSHEIARTPDDIFAQSTVSWDPAELDRMPPVQPARYALNVDDFTAAAQDSPMGLFAVEPRLGSIFGNNSLDLLSVRQAGALSPLTSQITVTTDEDVEEPVNFVPVNQTFFPTNDITANYAGDSAVYRNVDIFTVDPFAARPLNVNNRLFSVTRDGIADGYFAEANYGGAGASMFFDLGPLSGRGAGVYVIERRDGTFPGLPSADPAIDVHPNGATVTRFDARPLLLGTPGDDNVVAVHARSSYAGAIADWEYRGAAKPLIAGHPEVGAPFRFAQSVLGVNRGQDGAQISGIDLGYTPNILEPYANAGLGVDWTIEDLPEVTGETFKMLTGDFDLDGDIDVVMLNTTDVGIRDPVSGGFTVTGNGVANQILFNDGFGTFIDNSIAYQPNSNDITISGVVGDIDNDGDLDLIFLNAGSANQLYINQVLNSSPNLADTADATLFFEANVNTLPELYTGAVAPPFGFNITGAGVTVATVAGDINMDGRPDLLHAEGGQFSENGDLLRVLINTGLSRNIDGEKFFKPANSDFPAPVVSLFKHNLSEFERSFFPNGFLGDEPAFLTDVAIADFDGDGDNDIVAVELSPSGAGNRLTPRIWLNQDSSDQILNTIPDDDDLGDGIFDPSPGIPDLVIPGAPNPASFPQKKQTRRVKVADLSGNGAPDLFLVNGRSQGGNPNVYLRNNGSGIFTDLTETALPMNFDDNGVTGPEDYIYDNSHDAAVADFDHDGDVDIIIFNASNGYSPAGVRMLINEGGVFTEAPVGNVPGSRVPDLSNRIPRGVAILDVDLIGEVTEDANFNGILDPDEVEFINPDGIISWEDRPTETEDRNGNGILDPWETEDINGNGILDPGEDGIIELNGVLDTFDFNGNGIIERGEDGIIAWNGVLDQIDYNNDGIYTYREDGVWEGSLDIYISYDNDINVLLVNDPTNHRPGFFTNQTTLRFPDGLVDTPSRRVAVGNVDALVNKNMANGTNTGPFGYRFTDPTNPASFAEYEARPGNGQELAFSRFVGGNTQHAELFHWTAITRTDGTILRGVYRNISHEIPIAQGIQSFLEVGILGEQPSSIRGFANDVTFIDHDGDGDLDLHVSLAGNSALTPSVGYINLFYVNRLIGENENRPEYRNTNPTDVARSPVVLNMQPGGAKLGETREILVQGGNFMPGVEFALGGGIQVLHVEHLSVNEARIQIHVSEQAPLGPRAVYSRNTTGAGSLTKNGMFQVFQELELPLQENAVTEPAWMTE